MVLTIPVLVVVSSNHFQRLTNLFGGITGCRARFIISRKNRRNFAGDYTPRSWISYLELFKPRQTALLVTTGILGYLIASHGSLERGLYLVILSLILAVAGTTGLNMYFDRDIDSVMFRTRKRPIPSNRVSPGGAFLLSSLLLLAGLILAFRINIIVGYCVASGFFIDLVLYTVLLKRKTIWNIVVGALAGGMPALAGYTAFSGRVDLLAGCLLLLVFLWSLAHIWLIASYYIEDYRRAELPMLPVIQGIKATVFSCLGILLIMNLALFSLFILHLSNWLPLLISLLVSLPLAYTLIGYLGSGGRENLRRAYKILSPYLLAVFLALLLVNL